MRVPLIVRNSKYIRKLANVLIISIDRTAYLCFKRERFYIVDFVLKARGKKTEFLLLKLLRFSSYIETLFAFKFILIAFTYSIRPE